MGQEIFLPADPWTLLKTGKIADVPVMAGITADETAFFVQSNHHRYIAKTHITAIARLARRRTRKRHVQMSVFFSNARQHRSDE